MCRPRCHPRLLLDVSCSLASLLTPHSPLLTPHSPRSCQLLPSVLIAGAMTISAWCISASVAAPHTPMHVRKAPTRFCVPLVRLVGPNRMCSRLPLTPTLMRVPRGNPPVVTVPGRLVGLRERRADHDRVGAAGERLAHVATAAHATIGDDRDVAA